MKKFGNYLSVSQKVIQNNTVEILQDVTSSITFDFLNKNEDILKLKSIIENADKILEFINKKQDDDVEELFLLDIKKVEDLKDIKNTTIRVSESIDKKFTEFVKSTKYTKIQLLNLALVEFLEKYSK